MNRLTVCGAAAVLALAAAACGPKGAPEPQNEATAAMMPDTDAAANTGAATAPDAGDTGAAPPSAENAAENATNTTP
jgi:hypothetical protein